MALEESKRAVKRRKQAEREGQEAEATRQRQAKIETVIAEAKAEVQAELEQVKAENLKLTAQNAEVYSENARLTAQNAEVNSENARLKADNDQLRRHLRPVPDTPAPGSAPGPVGALNDLQFMALLDLLGRPLVRVE